MKIPTVRIWIEQRGSGDTAWAVLVDGEPWLVGATQRDAERRQHTLEVMASPEARAAARERIWAADNRTLTPRGAGRTAGPS